MKRLMGVGISLAAAALLAAAPAQADVDTDFTNELHTYGIYGQKDYNAWIGKITCKRLYKGLDKDANMSAEFVHDAVGIGQHHRAGVAVPRWPRCACTARRSCRFSIKRREAKENDDVTQSEHCGGSTRLCGDDLSRPSPPRMPPTNIRSRIGS